MPTPDPAPVYTYEVRRLDGKVFLYGLNTCPHCGAVSSVDTTPPSTPTEKFWTCICHGCKGTWRARLVEKVEVTSL
jgi:hypothetical protein